MTQAFMNAWPPTATSIAMATTASAGSHTLHPNELEVYVKFIGAGGFGEIHCVQYVSRGRVHGDHHHG